MSNKQLRASSMQEDVVGMIEYQQAVHNLNGRNVNQVNLKEVISAFQLNGIYYSARDTRRIDPAIDNMATLIYSCHESGCPSYIKITVTHNVITRVESQWTHNHPVNVLSVPRNKCSVCHEPGHKKRTCPIAKGRASIQQCFQDDSKLIQVIKDLKCDGWKCLGMRDRDMIHLVSIIPLQNPDLVRKFFFFAPNDESGIKGKKRLYSKIVHSHYGRHPSLFRDLQRLRDDWSSEDLANLVYALTWYAHYVVVCDRNADVLLTVQKEFELQYQKRAFGQSNHEVEVFETALNEAKYILDESHTVLMSVQSSGTLNVNAENMKSVSLSLVPNFLSCVYIQGQIHGAPRNLLRACWTIQRIIIDNFDVMACGKLSSLKTAQTVHSRYVAVNAVPRGIHGK